MISPKVVREGFGRHIWVTETDSREDYYIGLFISELVYIFGIVFVKWSILAFYWRIFSADTRIRLPIWIMFTMVCMWGISVVSFSLTCDDVHADAIIVFCQNLSVRPITRILDEIQSRTPDDLWVHLRSPGSEVVHWEFHYEHGN